MGTVAAASWRRIVLLADLTQVEHFNNNVDTGIRIFVREYKMQSAETRTDRRTEMQTGGQESQV
jgi:hypothetical protein